MDDIKRYRILCKLRDDNDQIYFGTELNYQSSFELLIAVLLSAQSKDIQVNKVTETLFKIANTPQAILNLGVDGIKFHIRSIGLFNIKSKNIIKICQLLINKYNGIIPNSRFELESLPGVGRKTSNVILNLIFGYPTIAVDTHVFRVCNRSKFAIGRTVISVERKLMLVVPNQFKKKCHQWLVRHGRYTCHSRNPQCDNCIIKDLCEFDTKNFKK